MRTLLLLSLCACNPPGRIDLKLRAPDGIALEELDAIELKLSRDPGGEEVARGEASGDRLADLATVLRRADIDPGERYVFEVRADVAAGVCPAGRLVGRSLPFEVESDDGKDTVAMYVACADSLAATEDPMDEPRALAPVVWDEDGHRALVIGGLSRFAPAPPAAEALDGVESYDVASGEFTVEGPLREARGLSTAATAGDGRILVLGGVGTGSPLVPLDSVEALEGDDRRALGSLSNRWGDTWSLHLVDGRIAVVGMAIVTSEVQVEIYDPIAGEAEGSAAGSVSRSGASVVPFEGRDRALVVGGGAETQPAEMFCATPPCPCDDPPCVGQVGGLEDLPVPTWSSAAGAYVPCPAGGGAAYVVGGEIGPEPRAISTILCFRDDPAEAGGSLVPVGEMHVPRTGASATLVRGSRLLVVGGTLAPTAEVLPVDGCDCARIAGGDIVDVPFDVASRPVIGRGTAVLGDGTVLVIGRVEGVGAQIRAEADAWVFEPDLP